MLFLLSFLRQRPPHLRKELLASFLLSLVVSMAEKLNVLHPCGPLPISSITDEEALVDVGLLCPRSHGS
jgi:hypothetical protein